MIKYRHIFLVILAILLLFAACSRNPSNPTGTEGTNTTGAIQGLPDDWDMITRPEPTNPDQYTTEIKVNVQYLPTVVDNPNHLPVLKWLCLMQDVDGFDINRVWNETAAIEANQMLADRDMPFRVQFVIYTSDYFYERLDWLARPEIQEDLKTADLIFHDMPMDAVEAYLEPLTQYITGNAEPSLRNAVPHEANWLQTTKNEEIYGISYKNITPTSVGWRVAPELLSKFGLSEQDFKKHFWEMDELLAEIYDKNGNNAFLFIPHNGVYGSKYIHAGMTEWFRYPFSVGAFMEAYFVEAGSVFAVDFSEDKPTIINVLDTDISRKIQAALARYDKAGYLIRDNADHLLSIGSLFGHRSYIDHNGNLAIPVTASTYDSTWAYLYQSNSVMAASKHKEEAISLLNLIAEDEVFRMQLLFGREGRDYTIDENGQYTLTKQTDGSNYYMAFLSPWGEFCNLKSDSGRVTAPAVDSTNDVIYEDMTYLESYREMWDKVGEPFCSIAFDFSGLKKEVEEVRIWAKYYFPNFDTMTEEEYDKMLYDINAAGGDKIMAELQKQLDEWVKANPTG